MIVGDGCTAVFTTQASTKVSPPPCPFSLSLPLHFRFSIADVCSDYSIHSFLKYGWLRDRTLNLCSDQLPEPRRMISLSLSAFEIFDCQSASPIKEKFIRFRKYGWLRDRTSNPSRF